MNNVIYFISKEISRKYIQTKAYVETQGSARINYSTQPRAFEDRPALQMDISKISVNYAILKYQ